MIYECLGKSHAEALIGFHVFTGCDQTGKFSGKSKKECFKTFLECTSDDLVPFTLLGCDSGLTLDVVVRGLNMFVMNLYHKRRPDNITTIPSLRYHLFSRFQKSAEQLPPTEAALYQKILRSHYVTHVLRNALKACPDYLEPTLYGWALCENRFIPVTMDEMPAPLNLIELTMCGCEKTKCESNRCRCKKHEFCCTDVCQCRNCENTPDSNHPDKSTSDECFKDAEVGSDEEYI